MPIGIYSLTAVIGKEDGTTVSSAPVTVRVEANVAPAITITSPTNDARFTVPGIVPLRVNASDAVGHITNVIYYVNGAPIVDVEMEPWSFNWANAPIGTHTITAEAIDDKGASTISAPISLTVVENAAPIVTLTATLTSTTLPGTVALSATANDSDGSISKVEFFNGSALLATLVQAPYSHTWSNVEAGTYSITARATDNKGAATISQPSQVTVAAAGGAQLYYVYADQIKSPREITNAAGVVVWRADVAEPFGSNIPNENPSGIGLFTFNMRFPGQYFDSETGLHYNYYRDYDPAIGRFIQSDPTGLDGGLNTYVYADASPLSYMDPDGLSAIGFNGFGDDGSTSAGSEVCDVKDKCKALCARVRKNIVQILLCAVCLANDKRPPPPPPKPPTPTRPSPKDPKKPPPGPPNQPGPSRDSN